VIIYRNFKLVENDVWKKNCKLACGHEEKVAKRNWLIVNTHW
jgi:hypothetical protein